MPPFGGIFVDHPAVQDRLRVHFSAFIFWLLVFPRFSPWFLLLLAALCLGGAYVSNHYSLAAHALQQAEARRVQELLHQAERLARQQTDELAVSLERGTASFGRLLQDNDYPTFVFRDQQLQYWSDHTVRPEPENVPLRFREKLVETRYGRYLVLRRPVGPYVVLTYVPLEQHYGISNRYLRTGSAEALFRGLNLRLVTNDASGDLPRIYATSGTYLFSVESAPTGSLTGKYVPAALLLLGMLLYLSGWLLLAQEQFRGRRPLRGTLAVVAPLLVVRAGLLYWGLPFSFIELPLFDPRVYAASALSPSLGDLLMNAVVLVVVVSYGVRLFRRYGVLRHLGRPLTPARRVAVGTVVVGVFYGLLATLYQFYASTFTNSQLNLDITQDIQVSSFKLLLLLAIVLHTGAYLMVLFLLTQCFAAIVRPATRGIAVVLLAVSTLVFLPLGILLNLPYGILLGLALAFFLILRITDVRPLAAVMPYQLYLLVFLMVGLSAATGSLALYTHFNRQLLQNKHKMADNLMVDNDLQGEFLLAERTRELAADPFVQARITGPFASQDLVRLKVVRYYLRDYFDKYEPTVRFFDGQGQSLDNPSGPRLDSVRRQLLRQAQRTDLPNLYLVHDGATFSTRRYVTFVAVPLPVGRPATLVLELALKKLTSYSLVPELLVDEKFFQPGLGPELSYAGFAEDRPVYNEGDFDYVNQLRHQALHDPQLYTTGLTLADMHHLGVRGPQSRVVIVTTPRYSFTSWLSNFSFLFLLHTFCWLVGGALYLLVRGRYPRMLRSNFSTKIQLFLNLGILIPLLVVSVATASQVTASYKRDLLRTYERRGKAVQDNLLRSHVPLADSVDRTRLSQAATTVARLTETDLNLYDQHGELLVSSQPLIFETGLLSPLMNPQALQALAERNQPRVLLSEQAGTLSFNALYLPLRSVAGGRVVGYVGIPFFDSEKELNTKLTELVDTILNIFTVMFILFLVLTFLAARYLTAPLKLLTEKLRHTTLTGQNEMLTYESSDEIGLLVREYNTMLRKLEESKQELAAQEKEAAWREMARQVAHEIKNPLTPMKLSLQFLQRAIQDGRADLEELIGRVAQTLITQIDVLTDIATSFSNFTNLPAMRPERLEVAAVLRRCVGLHQGQGHVQLVLPPGLTDEQTRVFADESLLVRTFNNLLINALQAVPPERSPEVAARVELVSGSKVRIAIQDNGTGIPQDVQEKIFVPNFTTKEKGSGIGLAVARRGIESAGGHIWFETRPDEGTTFFIELPLAG